ncbi:hypothetical protein ACVJGD_001146 [Bradyrhizobium sp. USDA 10063]
MGTVLLFGDLHRKPLKYRGIFLRSLWFGSGPVEACSHTQL